MLYPMTRTNQTTDQELTMTATATKSPRIIRTDADALAYLADVDASHPGKLRTRKSGAQVFASPDPCGRCGGRGFAQFYSNGATGTCFDCGGVDTTSRVRLVPVITYARQIKGMHTSNAKAKARAIAARIEGRAALKVWARENRDLHLGRYLPRFGFMPAGASSFLHVLADVRAKLCSKGSLSEGQLGMITKAMARDAERAAEGPGSYLGTVGERLRDLELFVKARPEFDGSFGTKFVVIMEDADGNTLVWKTGRPGCGTRPGATVKLTGTVKAHDERNGKRQTILARCLVELLTAAPQD